MSEFQYYEFQAIDRPLTDADRKYLRTLSSRAEITSRSLTNTYQWGDFKGDPVKLMVRCFDLHLYWANWGTRRFMVRVPDRLVDRALLERCVGGNELVRLDDAGANVVLSISSPEDEQLDEEWDGGEGLLGDLARLRDDLLAGDQRFYYLLWLLGVPIGEVRGEAPEPLPGLGPLTAPLLAFGKLFDIDPDLMHAAAERPAVPAAAAVPPDAGRGYVRSMTEAEKSALLLRLLDGDPHVAADLQAGLRAMLAADNPAPAMTRRTLAELQARTGEIREAREQKAREAARAAAERQAKAAERARRARLDALAQRGKAVWPEVEAHIELRNAGGYDRATALLVDLEALAKEEGTEAAFARRMAGIRERHGNKKRFIERIEGLG